MCEGLMRLSQEWDSLLPSLQMGSSSSPSAGEEKYLFSYFSDEKSD